MKTRRDNALELKAKVTVAAIKGDKTLAKLAKCFG
jgi:hypothetical protein